MPFEFKNRSKRVSMSNGRPTYEYQMVVCPCLDDIRIFVRTPNDNIDHGVQVMTSLHDARLTLNLKKWRVFIILIEYLGHVVCPGCFELSIRTIDRIRIIENLTTVMEPWASSLGLGNFFCRFGPSFAHVAAPRDRKLRKGQCQTFILNYMDSTWKPERGWLRLV